MPTINIKPLSVNEAWQGRRFKTNKYLLFEKTLLFILPKNITVTDNLYLEFGMSKSSDIDNPIKMIIDILCKKYHFNDNSLTELHIKKVIVKKGFEYFKFEFFQPI